MRVIGYRDVVRHERLVIGDAIEDSLEVHPAALIREDSSLTKLSITN